ncbi:MAG TPA: glycosyltransferase family 4 protein [Candidatus Acidoferrales bacterium]|nr:glycosyltransferase family 4 protein [Candidatus Acidoferrales bacterium]
MHILLLNEYYPPDTSATAKMAAQVAEVLAQRHRVTVVAGRPSYDPDEFYSWALLHKRVQNGVAVERVGSTAFPRHDMRKRVTNYLSYTTLAVPRAVALRPDVVLAMTDPPFAGIAGATVSKMTGRPFVYNIRDLYPEMAVGGDIVNRSSWTDRWERLHCRALRQAARVIVLGDDMRDRIVAKGIAPERVRVIRDGSLPAPIPPDLNHPVVQQIRCGFPFVVVHAGNLGFYGAWNTLLKAAAILRNENVGFVFIGDGANRAALEQQSSALPNVRFLPFRPASEIPHVMAAGDIHVVTVRRGLEGVVVPSKLYSILAAGRPVLVVAPPTTDAARIVSAERCGVAADPDDAQAVADAILRLRDDSAGLAEMACRSHAAAEKYARVKELHSFLAVLEEIHHPPARNGGGHLGS